MAGVIEKDPLLGLSFPFNQWAGVSLFLPVAKLTPPAGKTHPAYGVGRESILSASSVRSASFLGCKHKVCGIQRFWRLVLGKGWLWVGSTKREVAPSAPGAQWDHGPIRLACNLVGQGNLVTLSHLRWLPQGMKCLPHLKQSGTVSHCSCYIHSQAWPTLLDTCKWVDSAPPPLTWIMTWHGCEEEGI